MSSELVYKPLIRYFTALAAINIMKTSHLIKFFIGFIAGLCAALLPKLMAIFSMSETSLQVLSTSYIIASVILGVLIGAIIMFFEWGEENRAPKDTFMAALALPALLSGSLNTANGVKVAADVVKENEELTQQLVKKAGIDVLKPTQLTPVTNPAQPQPVSWNISIISPVIAAPEAPLQIVQFNFELGIQTKLPKAYVVLAEEATLTEAQSKADALRSQVPDVGVVQTANGSYLVLSNTQPVSKSQAVLDVINLRQKLGTLSSPKLLEAE